MGLLNLAQYVASVAVLLIAVFVVRPWVARARVGQKARIIEYRIMDAVLAGDIDATDPALEDLIAYSRLLSEHAQHVGLTEGTAIYMAVEASGLEIDDLVPPQATYANMTPTGRRVAQEADKDLHRIFTRYLVDGSRVWFLLMPAVLLRHAHTSATQRGVDRMKQHWVTPNDAASGYRVAVQDHDLRGALSLA